MKSLFIASISLFVAGSAFAGSASLNIGSTSNPATAAVFIGQVGYLETLHTYLVVIEGSTGSYDVSCSLVYPIANKAEGAEMLAAIKDIAGNEHFLVTCRSPNESDNGKGGGAVQLDMTANNYTFGISELY